MQSFRTEIENPVVEKEIIELERKIRLFREGKTDEERFKSLRLARGIYGQRQPGVQMIRIKLPYGKVTSEQLHRIADVSDEYSTGRLHITTRQDIQIHYVNLDRTPELWAELSKDDVTIREACGNTVRNVTGSETAGIDVDEPFDVTPYADATFRYMLRNPIGQEMGRKFKISFSASDEDTALSYMHDLGFIPRIKDGKRGFKVLLGGGLGSQPRHADVIYEFLEEDRLIPLIEGVVRIFDRYGERSKRMKARMKFLIKSVGVEEFMRLVEEEQKALPFDKYPINTDGFDGHATALKTLENIKVPEVDIEDKKAYEGWKKTNVIPQKQEGFVAIGIKVLLGDFYTDKARKLADLIRDYAGNEVRFSLRQNILVRHVREDLLPFFYTELRKLGFTNAGYNTTGDVTACPGTDTCNLGIANSTGIAEVLEGVLKEEYPEYLNNKDVAIKISGCMNACGQHMMAHIGFQGMSIRSGKLVAPALQVLLGGGVLGNGNGRFADKVIKIPSKRGPQALRTILDDFKDHAESKETFLDYYDRQGKTYFYEILKPLSDTDNLTEDDFKDWGHTEDYKQEVGVGECAGVVIDLVATLLFESEEKIDNAIKSIEEQRWSDSIYHAYSALINTAKALLLSENKKTNTHAGIVKQFQEVFVDEGKIELDKKAGKTFADLVYQINKNEPSGDFAKKYLADSRSFFNQIKSYREQELVAS
ncbi:HEPN domain-containing protein [Sinomicrobium weinanense]|uniref:HEPN domain-containing protein n=1 Tax=Sinomicrobium weinanense TaxID=2842200 RepID=A0A926JRX9_9FLAO|nr:HEPN domain-containing protein [Sinomicrobium weinanense]MBC9796199.1 HEPN domain-containing protein [Sinomicrobium weinanense]MBU3123478.1 HEPN domain-containing protein [Sinomicrobium weinanense]